MPGEKAEDGPVLGQLIQAWKIPGIPWESWCGVKSWADQDKPHSHFCLLLGGVGHVDNGSFCVCVHCGEQERQGWSRAGRGVTAALSTFQRGGYSWDGGREVPVPWHTWAPCVFPPGTLCFSPSTRTGLDLRLDPSRMQGWTSPTHQYIPSYTQLVFACRDNSFPNFSGTRSIPGNGG